MALPDHAGMMKKLLASIAALALSVAAVSGCVTTEKTKAGEAGQSALQVNPPTSRSQNNTELPPISKEELSNALPWLIATLELDKRYQKDDLQIDSYEISPDKQYAILNLSNGALTGTKGPFYRFLVLNPKAQRIFYPAMSTLRSNNLGYPYIAAKFGHRGHLAIAYGYRSITASTISLPGGDVIENRELEVFDINEIEKALTRMVEQPQ